MMSYDERLAFDRLYNQGIECEKNGNFASAINKYQIAMEIAKLANDSAVNDCQEKIEYCQKLLKQKNIELEM